MPPESKNPIDKQYDTIMSFYDGDIKHLQNCQSIIPQYPEITSAENLRKSITLVNIYVRKVTECYIEPIQLMLETCKKSQLTRFVGILLQIFESIETIKGMIDTLPKSPLGSQVNQLNFTNVPTYYNRIRDKVHFIDSILLQNAVRLRELENVFQSTSKEAYNSVPEVQKFFRMMALAYEDRWRLFSQITKLKFD